MDLRLLISLALCCMRWEGDARPQGLQLLDHAGVQEAISNLKLLNSLSASDQHALIAEDVDLPSSKTKYMKSYKSNKQKHSKLAAIQHPSPLSHPSPPPPLQSRYLKPYKEYSDGAFSDIPSDAFQLEHRKEFRLNSNRSSVKKDLTHAHRDQPDSLVRTCLNYFQGRSNPEPSDRELILNICNELLDDNHVQEYSLDDDKRQQLYDISPETHHHHNLGPGVTVDCDLCPHGHHLMKLAVRNDDDDDDSENGTIDDDKEDIKSVALLSELLELFKPYGSRREWMVINSKNPERMRTYVDVKK